MANDGVSSGQRSSAVRNAADYFAHCQEVFAQEFLLAKLRGKTTGENITDKTAEMQATVATEGRLTKAEAEYIIALQELYDGEHGNEEPA